MKDHAVSRFTKHILFIPFSLVVVSMTVALSLGPYVIDAQEPSLFERLGGEEALDAVVGEFLGNVAADDRINSFFANTDLDNLHRLLVEQLCEATGGPCTYSGRSMKDSHAGLGIGVDHFTALVEDLVVALNTFSVPEKEQSELLGALGMLQGDIVEEDSATEDSATAVIADFWAAVKSFFVD